MKNYEKLIEAWSTLDCVGEIVDKYWPIIENVINQQRDAEIKEHIFETEGEVSIFDIFDTIDNYENAKEALKDTLWSGLTEVYEKL